MLQTLLLSTLNAASDDTMAEMAEIAIGTDGAATYPYPELPMQDKFDVLFENKSGFDTILFWVNPRSKERVEQSTMPFPSYTTIGTYPGHQFVFALTSDTERILRRVIMSPYVDVVTLLPAERMQLIDEADKLEFHKQYYLRSGRRWKNYFPRDPLTYSHLNISHIGHTLRRQSAHAKYFQMTPKTHQLLIAHNSSLRQQLDTHKAGKSATPRGTQLKAIDQHEFAVDTHLILSYNHSEYYRDKSTHIIELDVLCTAPRVMRVKDFLSDDECEHLVELGRHVAMDRSTVGETKLSNDARSVQCALESACLRA